MIRTAKPKNARSKRAMQKKEPKLRENPKQALFVPGSNANKTIHDLFVDLSSLKKPLAKRFTRKNDILPFEDASSLEFFSEKNDCSLLVLGTHNKKRPNNLTFARTFNNQIYDMFELKATAFKSMKDFRKSGVQIGMKPMMSFNGSVFETNPTFQQIKSYFLDFYRGEETDLLDPAGLQYVISLTADEPTENDSGEVVLPKLYFRVYLLKTFKSNTPKIPRVELEEMGPSIDFVVGRIQSANPELEKQALKEAKLEGKTKKNIEGDSMGDKIGRIHMEKQDLGKLQTRKMKGLKRKYDQVDEEDNEDAAEYSEGEVSEDDFDGFE